MAACFFYVRIVLVPEKFESFKWVTFLHSFHPSQHIFSLVLPHSLSQMYPRLFIFPPEACFLLLKSFCSVLFSENMSSCFWTGFPFSDRWHIVNEFLLAGFNCQLSHSHRNSTIWWIQVYFQFLLYWTMNSKKWQGRWIKWKGGDMYGSSS